MRKIDILREVRASITEIRTRMSRMEENVQIISDCIETKKLIPKDVGEKVASEIMEVTELSCTCREKYEQIFATPIEHQEIQLYEDMLDKQEKELIKESIGEASRFLDLHSSDDETNSLLQAEQKKFLDILSRGEITNNTLEPYKKLVEAIKSRHSIDPSMGFQIAEVLRKSFGDTVAAHAVFYKDIDFADKVITENNVQDEADAGQKDREGDDADRSEEHQGPDCGIEASENKNAADSARGEVLEEKDNEPVHSSDLNAIIEENKIDEFAQILIRNGAKVNCTEDLGRFIVKVSDRETKKIGVKNLKNDIRNSGLMEAPARLLKVLYDEENLSKAMALSELDGKPLVTILSTLDYLMDKGYLKEYTLPGVGSFYTASSKTRKLYSSVEAKKFLQISATRNAVNKNQKMENDNDITSHLAQTIAEEKNTVTEGDLALICSSGKTWRDSFIKLFYGVHEGTGEREQHAYVGFFLQDNRNYSDIKEEVDREFNKCDALTKVVFMGTTDQHSQSIADSFMEYMGESLAADLYSYSIKDDVFRDLRTGSIVTISEVNKDRTAIVDEMDQGNDLVEGSVKKEHKNSDSIEEIDLQSEGEDLVDSFSEEKESIEEKSTNEGTEEDVLVPIYTVLDNSALNKNKGKPLEDAAQMICNDRTYCATAYLRACGENNEDINSEYEKLALAVNDPLKNYSYSSDTLFSIFPDKEDGLNNYLMVAAAIRTFFYNHISYDYSMKSLYEGRLRDDPLASECPNLSKVIYQLLQFKEGENKGMDVCADYRMKDRAALDRNLRRVRQEARDYYENYILGKARENASHKRFIETRRIAFAQDGDIAVCLKAIMDDKREDVVFIQEYLEQFFIKEGSMITPANIDESKIEDFIAECWGKAASKIRAEKKSSDLMGSLRQNFHKSIQKAIGIMCRWCEYNERISRESTDKSYSKYQSGKKVLLDEIEKAMAFLQERRSSSDIMISAGARILADTLEEIHRKLEGTYSDHCERYFYIDFLKGSDVLLDSNYMPILSNRHRNVNSLSVEYRVKKHSEEDHEGFDKRLEEIFSGQDDYGSGKLILDYLEDIGDLDSLEKTYDVEKSVIYAEQHAKSKRVDFEGTIELMENRGQIDNTHENVKEKLLQIADEEYRDSCVTKNFGFFSKVISAYEEQIKGEAKTMEEPLRAEIKAYQEAHKADPDYEEKLPRIEKVLRIIEEQNYTVAEDLLSRLRNNEPEGEHPLYEKDYLEEFISGHSMYMKMVNNTGKSVNVLMSRSTRTKAGRGAMRLAENWIDPGAKPNQERTRRLLMALGFPVDKIEPGQRAGKIENFKVTLQRPENGRKENLTHPIAVFGSKAYVDGFRVAFLLGKYDADGLIEAMKEIGNAKDTIIFLDYALTLNDRRKLARKIKEAGLSKVFGVVDRTLLAYIMEKYDEMKVSKILMSTMMPFASYQPYISDSASVMTPEMFMGRRDELAKIESPEGVNIVYGGRQLGKSALLRMAQNDIDNNENGDRAVLVDIKGRDYKQSVKKIADELKLRGIINDKTTVADWDDLSMALKSRLLDNERRIPYLLLLLDEADAFIDSCVSVNYEPFDALKDVQSVGVGRFKFVIAGLRNVVKFNREIALGNNSVLTHLKSTTVKPFKPMEARELLETPLYYLGLRFPPDKQSLITMIFARANYFPGLIQLYCGKLIEAMRKSDYAGYNEAEAPAYLVNEDHIKKVLADEGFRQQIREKFEITLKLDEDNYYYLIALLMAQLYHDERNVNGYSASDIIQEGTTLGITKIEELETERMAAFMDELVDLNILRRTSETCYLFNRFNFLQMMGSRQEVEEKLLDCMED